VLSRDVRFEGFGAEQWSALLSLWPAAPERKPHQGGVLAVSSGQRLCKLVSTTRGRLDPTGQSWPITPEELAGQHQASFAIAFEVGCLDALMDRFGERLRREHDYLAQLLTFLELAGELEREGQLSVWPWRVGEWHVPSERTVLTALDSLVPVGKCAVLGVFDHGRLATCLALRRARTGFDRILGPDALGPPSARPGGDFRRAYPGLAAAVEDSLGPIAFGCYAERATLERLLSSAVPGAWAAATLAREVVVAPASAIIAVPLGIDLARAAVVSLRRLSGIGPLQLFQQLYRLL
jgi:hypothetical protein